MLDPRNFEEINQKYYKEIYNFVFSLTKGKGAHVENVEDLTQEILLKAWLNYDRLQTKNSITSWIYRIARNHVYHFYRRKSQANISLDLSNSSATTNATEGAHLMDGHSIEHHKKGICPLERWETRCEVISALSKLQKNHLEVIRLHYYDEMEVEDIAKVLKVPVGTVKSRLFRAREVLKERLRSRILAET